MITEEEIIEKYDSVDNFFNCTAGKLDKVKDSLDEGMYELCKIFEKRNYISVSSCNGNNRRSAYIIFHTDIKNIPELENKEFCKIEHNTNSFGSNYIKLVFSWDASTIAKIIYALST